MLHTWITRILLPNEVVLKINANTYWPNPCMVPIDSISLGSERGWRKDRHRHEETENLESGGLGSHGEAREPQELRVFLLHSWTGRQKYCIQLNKDAGFLTDNNLKIMVTVINTSELQGKWSVCNRLISDFLEQSNSICYVSYICFCPCFWWRKICPTDPCL